MNLKLNILALVGKAKEQVFPIDPACCNAVALVHEGSNYQVDKNVTFCCLFSKVQRY
jgi:hypothetical protein